MNRTLRKRRTRMGASDYVKTIRRKIGHDFLMMVGVSALIFNEANEILLVRRSDNGNWMPVGGGVDPGETPAEAAKREVREEVGVEIEIDRVTGVYASPRFKYVNGDDVQYVTTGFRCRIISGQPHVADDESTQVGFFALNALPEQMSPMHLVRINDAAEPGSHQPAKFA